MTTEERLARVETIVEAQGKAMDEMRDSLAELARIANMGRGALWLVLKFGAVVVGLAAVGKVVVDLIQHMAGKHP